MSADGIRLDPDATPEEAEAVRQALAALGLIEQGGEERSAPPGPADRDP